MERYLQIGKENLKFNMPIHLIVAAAILLLSPLVLGMTNLTMVETVKILDYYVVFIGVILLPPLFLPEQNVDLRDLVNAKYTSPAAIYVIRGLQAIIALAIYVLFYLLVLKAGNCEFEFALCFFATMAGMVCLGSMGVFAYSLTDNVVIGYMIPIIFYMINYGSGEKYLKHFYLFSMMKGSYTEKLYLFAAGMVFLVCGILYRSFRRK